MVTYVDKSNQRLSLIKPDNTYIHIYTELKQAVCALYLLYTKRRVHWIFCENSKLVFELLLFGLAEGFVKLT